jgi:hypothetical protein
VQLFFYTVVFSGFGANEIDRFEAPSTLACGLLLLDALWSQRGADERGADERGADAPGRGGARSGAWSPRLDAALFRRVLPRLGAVAVALGSAVLVFDVAPAQAWSNASADTRLAMHVLGGQRGFTDRFRAVRAQYGALNAAIPAGARVLAAVDEPSLLSFSRFSFATLDLAGSASPPPHMPFFAGAAADIRYLRALGFDYIAADSPTQRGLYNLASWQVDLYLPNFNYRAWAPYFIDWSNTVTALERDPAFAVRHFGTLTLIRIVAP